MGAEPLLVRKTQAREQIDIERLIFWAFQVEHAEQSVRRDSEVLTGCRSTWDGIAAIERLGCFIDGGGAFGMIGDRCPDDAITVYEVVASLPREMSKLVLSYSASGLRPDWYPDGVGRFVPVRDGKGRIKYDWKYPAKRMQAVACHIRFEGTRPEVVENGRAVYGEWWRVLNRLSVELWGCLDRYDVIGPTMPRRPWCEGNNG